MMRYLALTLVFTATFLALLGGILAYKYYRLRDLHADPRLGQLLRYQERKIATDAGWAQVVFVGDSSLGNALDADLFSRLTGRRAVNLALTGSFHYAGAYVQLRELAKRTNDIKTVVLMYAVDAPAQSLTEDGLFFMRLWPVVPQMPLSANIKFAKTSLERLTDAGAALDFLDRIRRSGLEAPLPVDLLQEDYIVSGAQIALHDNGFRVPPRPGRLERSFLALIGALCADQGWRCLYAHGPLLDYALTLGPGDHGAYFAAAKEKIEATGLTVVTPGPVLFTPEQRGDTFFHVHPDQEEVFTELYAAILKNHLRD